MQLKEIYSQKRTVISFEIFPPKEDSTGEKIQKLYKEIETLTNSHKIDLVSITCGAGGSNNRNSFNIAKELRQKTINVMPHITCISSEKEFIKKQIFEYKDIGINNVLALRGDRPKDSHDLSLDFSYANELVEYINRTSAFSIAVAGYPEGHIDAIDLNTDIKNLKRKVNAGADAIFTQLFFDNEKFYKYLELLQKNDINIPVITGIFPIRNYNGLMKMLSIMRVSVPVNLKTRLESHKEDNDYIRKLGVEYSTIQCLDLLKNKIKGLHFYTLNQADSTMEILKNLGL